MTDHIATLADLSLERRKLDEELLQIQERRNGIDARIREVAALVAHGGPTVASPSLADDFADIQRRQFELLWLLKESPHGTSSDFAEVMYDEDTETTRRSVSAYFSRLKAAGYVISTGRGQFQLTARGRKAAQAYEGLR